MMEAVKDQCLPGLLGGGAQVQHRAISGHTLYDTIMMECRIPRGNPTTKCGLWVGRMCPWRLISCNKGPTLVWDIDTVGGYVGDGGQGVIWELHSLCSILL